jgi:hypothetical protein
VSGVHQLGADLGEFALIGRWDFLEILVAQDEIQDGIPQELHPLVVDVRVAAFVGVRAMGQGFFEE